MNPASIIGVHLEIIRKRWLIVLIVGILVLLAGRYYHSRQTPLFEARTKLKIIRAYPRSTSDVPFSFEEDQVFYNTQYNLLRTQLDWADTALDRAAWLILDRGEIDWRADPEGAGQRAVELFGGGIPPEDLARIGAPAAKSDFVLIEGTSGTEDPSTLEEPGSVAPAAVVPPALRTALASVRRELISESWGYNPDSFLASVAAQPLPGTYLVELSFQSGDRSLAVLFSNLYSELYRDMSRKERAEILLHEIRKIWDRQEKLHRDYAAARDALDTFRSEHPSISSSLRTNLPKQLADTIAARINEFETNTIVDTPQEASLRSLLAANGVVLVESERGDCSLVRKEGLEGGGDLRHFLASSQEILEHPTVLGSPSVAQLRERLRRLERERYDLPPDLTEESPQVRRIKGLTEDATRELGEAVESTICRYFDQVRRTRETLDALRERLAEKTAEALELDEEYTELERLEDRLAALQREKDSAGEFANALKAVKENHEGQPERDALNVQNIEIERRARFQDAARVRPNSTTATAVTVVLALLLSVGVAYLLEFLDDSIKTKADLDRTVGIPQIGLVPRIGARDNVETAVLKQPRSPVAEACRSIRTAILFSRRDEEIKSFAITSATQGEGKTTICANLAVTMAQARRGKILLIDADLRRARIHQIFGLENTVGLTNYLIGNETLADAVQESGVPDLFVLTSGPIPPNPAELLGGHQLGRLIEEARGEYGKIIIDTTPVVPVTDASLVAPLVDGVFLVVSAGNTSGRLVVRAKETLESIGVKVSGAILNSARSSAHAYAYGYVSHTTPATKGRGESE